MDLKSYCKLLPKIELHAHLNGSLSENTLKQLGCLTESITEYSSLVKILQKTERTLDECFDLFKVAHKATSNIDNLYVAASNVIKEFQDDGVIYLELRTTPRAESGMTKRQYIETVLKAIKHSTLTTKLLLSIDRRHDTQTSNENLELFIQLHQEYPDYIVGVDLSGNPNDGEFNEILFEKARQNGLKISLHCAEIKNDSEIMKMLQFAPDRIGHATCIHPKANGSDQLWENYLESKIPIEACITSNVICGTTTSYKDHHVQHWISNNLPYVLCTDDKGVFSTSLSNEYNIFATTFNITKKELYQLACKAVGYTFATASEQFLMKKTFTNFSETL